MAVYFGARVRQVTIAPDRDDGPRRYGDTVVEWPLDDVSRKELCARMVLVALAGPVAEMIYRSEPLHPGFVGEWSSDWYEAWDVAEALFSDEKRRLRFLEQSVMQLKQLLSQDSVWAALAAIVDELEAHHLLEGPQVEEIVATWMPDF